MTLVRFDEISLKFGDQTILNNASLTLEAGERVGLIGRNGAGKSTTFKLITGEQDIDAGEIHFADHLVVSQLAQDLPEALDLTVHEAVSEGLAETQALVDEYEVLSQQQLDAAGLRALEELQQRIDVQQGWQIEQRVDTMLSELDLPPKQKLNTLSGGWRRRVALAKALVNQPDLLMLDEPTNHLDIATIEWLENKIYNFHGAVLFVTHDRAFLQRLSTRIVELDRGQLVSWPGHYENFLRRKAKALEDEFESNKLFDKKLSEEEVWVRQGIKARRTRNEGRVRSLLALRETYASRLKQPPPVHIHIEAAEPSGRKVIRARNVSYGYEAEPLIKDFNLALMRGQRIGLIGNNGVGKSTLLKLLLGELTPDTGTIKLGTNLELGYFDQLRAQLDVEKSVAYNVGDGREYIMLGGRERHIIGYLKGFLFEPKRAQMPVKVLSGGERNRVILAKLFTQATNLLVLDEPTNDLDVETLEVLERELKNYPGTLIVVSHDRAFLDHVVDEVLVFEQDGQVGHYVGGYSDWLKRNKQLAEKDTPKAVAAAQANKDKTPTPESKKKKLSFNEQYELKQLPTQIAELEQQIAVLQQATQSDDFYQQPHDVTTRQLQQLAEDQLQLEQLIARWVELEEND